MTCCVILAHPDDLAIRVLNARSLSNKLNVIAYRANCGRNDVESVCYSQWLPMRYVLILNDCVH